MSEITRGRWAAAYSNGDFLVIETYSGYRGGHCADYKGKQNFLAPDAEDTQMGDAVLDALAHSRLVLPAPREGLNFPAEVEFDSDLYDYKKNIERYAAWTKTLMDRYGYKTKRVLFKNMLSCNISVENGMMKIRPMRQIKQEQWHGLGANDVDIPADSSPTEIGAALRLAFSRCAG
jgi:hypothetical protein